MDIFKNASEHYRGLHIVVVNLKTGKIEYAQAFDTYKRSTEFDEFIEDPIPKGFIILAACKDDCITNLSEKGI